MARSASSHAALGTGFRRAGALAAPILDWTPVWVPLALLAQLLWLGLRPAQAESARLDRAEAEVRARAAALASEEQALGREARMLEDPVYQERVRRSLVDPAAAPLRLEHARGTPGP
jgi:glycine/D-amino acid oxidase-like deaminating enzyme